MKHLFISALLVGELACPVIHATEESAMAPSAAEGEQAIQPQHEHGQHKRHHNKKGKHHSGKRNKHKHRAHKAHKRHHRDHDKKHHKTKQMNETETPAEQKIEEETELTNR
jgi:hypothetical protein